MLGRARKVARGGFFVLIGVNVVNGLHNLRQTYLQMQASGGGRRVRWDAVRRLRLAPL
jgi:hypothetical protein